MVFSIDSLKKKPSKVIPEWTDHSKTTLALYNAALEVIDIQEKNIEESDKPQELIGRDRTLTSANITKHLGMDRSNMRSDRHPRELFTFINDQNERLKQVWKVRCQKFTASTNSRRLLKPELEQVVSDLKKELALEGQMNLHDFFDQLFESEALEEQKDLQNKLRSAKQDISRLEEKCTNQAIKIDELIRELNKKRK